MWQAELDQLRAELGKLWKRERELLRELFDVRAAAEIRKRKIFDISKVQPVAVINRLPVEVFSRILHFALSIAHCGEWFVVVVGLQKRQFMAVSRRWRDVVLNSPSLWSVICLCSGWRAPFVEMHVTRSREHPLDITFGDWDDPGLPDAALRSIFRCTHRWRSINICACASFVDCGDILGDLRSIITIFPRQLAPLSLNN
ncbi:hypothetical protein EDC04DRAFT_2826593 [Pisolithus marmoratus]|nr:hypothetical protein EDC04DRAFT_2826593 [Pisolithus marmoratus]